MKKQILISILLSLALQIPAYSKAAVPKIIVTPKSCPFECCKLGDWIAQSNTEVFESPNRKKLKRIIKKGEHVTAIVGESHSKLLLAKFNAEDETQNIHAGDTVYVLHGVREGAMAIWHEGRVKEISDGQQMELLNKADMKPDGTWAISSVWWVKVRFKDGKEGWLKAPRKFNGMDSCS